MDKAFLFQAIELSRESVRDGGFPVGAILVRDNEVVGSGLSNGKKLKDATSHAEIEAIRSASNKIGKRDIKNSTIYSSLEPCLMCFSASYWAGVTKIVYACSKTKVSKQHYEGLHDLQAINEKNNRKIEIIHFDELENEALGVIEDWENKLGKLRV